MLRRRALLAAPALLIPRRASAQASGAELLLFCVADLHSASATAPQLVAAVDAALAAHPDAEAMILVNGDVFERGNAIARRSDGAGDWALLDALRDRAPVVLNIGNHETALVDDLAEVVRRARERDLVVVSSIRDARTGRPVADTRMRWPLRRQRQLGLVGIATDDAATYREAARAELILPEPVAWARAVLPWALDGADVRVVLSHAGLAADRAILPLLPDGTLMIGGHEHLRLTHAAGATRYVHTGSWGRFLTVAAWVGGVGWRLAEVPLTRDGPGDAALAARLRDVAEAHLAPEDREVVA
ncbi:MAG: metallophosphoesterase, partial [Acetobacteraceae bacterium]|nr:metallophosphoesterase [Acetobacteraceae bacterium]